MKQSKQLLDMPMSVNLIGLNDYLVAYKSLLHMLYVKNTVLVMEKQFEDFTSFILITNRANIIKRDLTMQCNNTISEIWSNENVIIFIS